MIRCFCLAFLQHLWNSTVNIHAHIEMHASMHEHYCLTLNFRHKVISSGNDNPQEAMESFKYPLMELSCKHHPQGENAVSLYSLQEYDHWQFSVTGLHSWCSPDSSIHTAVHPSFCYLWKSPAMKSGLLHLVFFLLHNSS